MTVRARALEWLIEPADRLGTVALAAAPRVAVGTSSAVTSAAVLGRAGEAEPVAAALALALGRPARARAGTVAVIGAAGADPSAGAAGGHRAARRLADRLEAHGIPARSRGRLAWARIAAGDEAAPTARRAALAGAPAVLAVTAPRTAALDEVLVEQDLVVIVHRDPDGALAALARATLPGVPSAVVRPLSRGTSRALARAGLRAPRAVRALLSAPSTALEAV